MRKRSSYKNSTKILIAATIVAAVIFGISQFFSCCEGSGEVIAKVNGKKIYKSQFDHKLQMMLGSQGQEIELPKVDSLPAEVIEIIAKEIYLEEKLSKIAQKSNAAKTADVRERIKATKNAILRQAYLDSLIKEATTDEKISQKYDELSSELKDKKEYSLAHIVVKEKAEAEKIIADLKRKKRFNDLAKKYSLDKESAANGGELGFVLENNLVKEIADEVLKMQKGEISTPIQTKFGWHVVKLVDVRDAKALPFEDVKENVRQQLIKNVLEAEKNKIIKDVKVEVLVKKSEAKPENVEGEMKKEESKTGEEIAPLDDAALEEKSEKRDELPKSLEE